MKEKRYHIVLASIVFALLMWCAITMGYEYTIVKQVPVVLENMKPGKVLKHPIPHNVAIRFKGHGWELATMSLFSDVKYYIDVSPLSSDQFLVTSRDLSEHIKTPLTIQPLDIKPETLMLALGQVMEKRVPVIPDLSLRLREGFGQVGPIRVMPESVLVTGSEKVLDSLNEWHTTHLRYDDLRMSIDQQIAVEEPASLSMDIYPTVVRLQVDVQQFAEKTIPGVPITAVASPLNREVIFIPPKIDVIVRGGIEQLGKLSQGSIQATIDYQVLVEDSLGTIVPTVTAPSGIKVIQKTPERFQFFIRKKI